MAYRKLENLGEKIITAAIEIGAQEGIHKITATKVARAIDASDFTVCTFYGSKQAFIDEAAKSVDRQFRKKVYALIDKGRTPEEFWDLLHKHLMRSPDSVLYYCRYKVEVGTDVLDKPDKSELLPRAKKLFGDHDLTVKEYQRLWDYTLSSALAYAEEAIRCGEDAPSSRKFMAKLVFSGINSVLE